MLKVLVGDDHPIFRLGITHIFEKSDEEFNLDEASDGEEVLSKVAKNDYDIVLLDITMPKRDGLDVLKQLKAERPKLPVLIISMYPEKHYAVRALKLGASGYLTKNSVSTELLTAITKILQKGGRYITSSLADQFFSHLKDGVIKQPHETLSEREQQVMFMICSGKSIKEIAESLSLNPKTISVFHTRILKKMKLKNDVELSQYAMKHNLVY